MRNLTSLLERFSKLLNKDRALKENVASVIKERIGITLSPENINLKDGILELNISSSAAKNEIRLREESIKSALKEIHNIAVSRVLYK